MDIKLTDEEIRVLGCLMEKEMATPDYYPLSLNALANACNQKSNRDPVVSYDNETVISAISGLRNKKFAMESSVSRVPKYAQTFSKAFNLNTSEDAVMCILMVRGPQTLGEIRGRTERLYIFSDLDEVEKVIKSLEVMELVTRLPRLPGRKESRYVHLLGEDISNVTEESISVPENAVSSPVRNNASFEDLRTEIEILRKEVESLKTEFEDFKKFHDHN